MGKFLDKFRPGDYLRELSVVILGVAVTFAGSAMITNHTVRKNIKENMRLIKIEPGEECHEACTRPWIISPLTYT